MEPPPQPKAVNREIVQQLELLLKEARKGEITDMVVFFSGPSFTTYQILLEDFDNNSYLTYLLGVLERAKMDLLELIERD